MGATLDGGRVTLRNTLPASDFEGSMPGSRICRPLGHKSLIEPDVRGSNRSFHLSIRLQKGPLPFPGRGPDSTLACPPSGTILVSRSLLGLRALAVGVVVLSRMVTC